MILEIMALGVRYYAPGSQARAISGPPALSPSPTPSRSQRDPVLPRCSLSFLSTQSTTQAAAVRPPTGRRRRRRPGGGGGWGGGATTGVNRTGRANRPRAGAVRRNPPGRAEVSISISRGPAEIACSLGGSPGRGSQGSRYAPRYPPRYPRRDTRRGTRRHGAIFRGPASADLRGPEGASPPRLRGGASEDPVQRPRPHQDCGLGCGRAARGSPSRPGPHASSAVRPAAAVSE